MAIYYFYSIFCCGKISYAIKFQVSSLCLWITHLSVTSILAASNLLSHIASLTLFWAFLFAWMNTAKLFPSKKEKVCLCSGEEMEELQIVVKKNKYSHSVENSNFTQCLYRYLSFRGCDSSPKLSIQRYPLIFVVLHQSKAEQRGKNAKY